MRRSALCKWAKFAPGPGAPQILQEALALPREDRTRLVVALQESLEPDEEWEVAWAAEVERRMKEVDEVGLG
jgi:hypothetical protein